MQQISTATDVKGRKNVLHRVSDVPGGISMELASLVAGNVVNEGSPLAAPSSGLRKLCKAAPVITGTTTTEIIVATANNHFKVGDILTASVGGAAYAITVVTDNGDGTTTLTVGTAIDLIAAGDWVYQSSAAGAAAGALLNSADCILKSSFEVPSSSQVIYPADGLLHAVVVEDTIAPLYLAQLKGVVEAKY